MPSEPAPGVLLVHGLWMRSIAMRWLATRLRSQGFAPTPFGYYSLLQGLGNIPDLYIAFAFGSAFDSPFEKDEAAQTICCADLHRLIELLDSRRLVLEFLQEVTNVLPGPRPEPR